jgi:hypothetical protein
MPECNKKGERFTHPPPATPRRFKGLNYYTRFVFDPDAKRF